MRPSLGHRGLTPIELLVVIAIIGVLMAIFHADAAELLGIKDETPSKMKEGSRQGPALSKIDHHESLRWKSEVSGR
jgi:prepilin-type N-terminal cleavage/methylation domain-containing protein